MSGSLFFPDVFEFTFYLYRASGIQHLHRIAACPCMSMHSPSGDEGLIIELAVSFLGVRRRGLLAML